VPSIQPAIAAYAANGMIDSVPAVNALVRALRDGGDASLSKRKLGHVER
jgi:hypothetical protein